MGGKSATAICFFCPPLPLKFDHIMYSYQIFSPRRAGTGANKVMASFLPLISPLNCIVCQSPCSAVFIRPSTPSLSVCLSVCLSLLLSVFTQTPLPSLPSQHKSHLCLYIYRLEAVAVGCTAPSLRFPKSLDRRAAQIKIETTPLLRFFFFFSTCSAYRIQLI